MLDASLDRTTCDGSEKFSVPDADERRVSERNGSARKVEFERAVVEAVGRVLRATGYPALRDIRIEIERGIVALAGRVPTYHQKQLAQVTAQQVDGVRGIANRIEVVCCR